MKIVVCVLNFGFSCKPLLEKECESNDFYNKALEGSGIVIIPAISYWANLCW
jgi:hypothetical protein